MCKRLNTVHKAITRENDVFKSYNERRVCTTSTTPSTRTVDVNTSCWVLGRWIEGINVETAEIKVQLDEICVEADQGVVDVVGDIAKAGEPLGAGNGRKQPSNIYSMQLISTRSTTSQRVWWTSIHCVEHWKGAVTC